jgi:hypothetical protein
MLKAKTKLYPWKCFSCEKIYESNVEAVVIWDTADGQRLHACEACEDITHIEDVQCDVCGKEAQVVYTIEHDSYNCECGHSQRLPEEEEEDEYDEEP